MTLIGTGPGSSILSLAPLSLGGQLVTIVVQDDQAIPQPIDDVLIRVYSSPADIFLGAGSTGQGSDPPGTLTVALDGAAGPGGTTYIVRLSKPGVTFVGGTTQTIAVLDPVVPPATNTFDFVGTIDSLLAATDPDLCRITGVLTDVSLRPLKNRVVRFLPVLEFPKDDPRFSAHFLGNPTLIRSNILAAPVQSITDALGRIDVELPREGVYEVQLHGFEHPMNITELMAVPDAASADFFNLLFPFVTSVTFGTDPINITLSVLVIEEVDLTILASNGQTLTDITLLNQLLEFTSDDETVAKVTLSADAVLSVGGIEPGATTLQVARKDGTIAPRRPAAPALIFTPPSVVVVA